MTARTTRARHPLQGKVLRWDNEDEETFSVRRFIAPINDDLWLMEFLCPDHGEPLPGQFLMKLSDIADREPIDAEIFASWEAFAEHMADIQARAEEDADATPPRVTH